MNAEKVREMFLSCLFKTEELPPKDYVEVEGLTQKFGLHPQRLAETKPVLIEMIDTLPEQFISGKGGGWSFLNLVIDKDGHQWTDLQLTAQEFLVMCMGNGLARIQLPRDMWHVLPGGVPYVEFSKEGFKTEDRIQDGTVVQTDGDDEKRLGL